MSEDNIIHCEAEVLRSTALAQAQVSAEVDKQIATAKAYPRQISKVRDKIRELATIDKETAEKCWYALPRDGKVITGPSVRLAEIVASSYGNLRSGSRIVDIDEKHVTCQGICLDLETNLAVSVDVKRRITNKAGFRYSDDMILTTANAGSSIAFRNAIFKCVPMVLFKSILDKVKKAGLGEEQTFPAERDATVAKLVKMGADAKKIGTLLGKRGLPDLDTDDVITLKGLINAIEEGDTTIEEAFRVEVLKPKVETGQVSMDAIKPGNPAEHQSHDTKAPLKTGEGKMSVQPPKSETPKQETAKAQEGDGSTVSAEEYEVDLAQTKEDLQAVLSGMSPAVSDKILETAGIASLESCTDLARMKKAMESAKFWADTPKGKKK